MPRMKSLCRLARSKLRSSMTMACNAASPSVGEQTGARGEEVVVVTPVDRFDHLDRDELVEPAAKSRQSSPSTVTRSARPASATRLST